MAGEDQLGQLAVNGSVAGLLAYVVLRWQRADAVTRAGECKACAERVLALAELERGDKLMMVDALRRNTEALTRVVEAVRAVGANGHGERAGRRGAGDG